MATREENLKKINDALELLSDDELENVAGGGFDVSKLKTLLDALGESLGATIKHSTNDKV